MNVQQFNHIDVLIYILTHIWKLNVIKYYLIPTIRFIVISLIFKYIFSNNFIAIYILQ